MLQLVGFCYVLAWRPLFFVLMRANFTMSIFYFLGEDRALCILDLEKQLNS